jgi:MFS transporter, DHA1 family, multidrug resistance protein
VFVMEHLRLEQDQFGWFFVPTITGMMLGAFVSGRAAGRISGTQSAAIGFGICGIAAVSNVAFNLLTSEPLGLWAVLPMAINSLGIAMVFPILTLAILDMYPRQRGAASSLQSFTSLMLQSAVAGIVSPLISHDRRWLAFAAASFTLLGFIFWYWEIQRSRGGRMPEMETPAAETPAL